MADGYSHLFDHTWASMRWHLVIGLALVILLAYGGHWWWQRQLPPQAKDLAPVLAELKAYKASHGAYPADPRDLPSVKNLRKSHARLYFGESEKGEIYWYPHKVSAHRFSILCEPRGFEIFMPVETIKPWSISSFKVYRYHHEADRWQSGRIMWTHAGSYWYQRDREVLP